VKTSDRPRDTPGGVRRIHTSKREDAAYYDRIAGIYDTLAETPERRAREGGVHSLAAQPGESILEMGVGTGVSLVAFVKAVGPEGFVLGVDLSERMISRSQERIQEHGLGRRARLVRGDAARLPVRAGVVDGIFMSFTLELFDTPEIPVVLRECRRVLKGGGRIVVVALSNREPSDFGTRAMEWLHQHFPGLLNCRPIPVRESLEETGLRIVRSGIEHEWVPVETVLAVEPHEESQPRSE